MCGERGDCVKKSGTGATYRATVGGAKNDVVLNGDGNENDY